MKTVNVIEAIFFAALEKRDAGERAAYLDHACTGDPDLRRCVEKLLGAQPKVGAFLEAPAPGLPASDAQPTAHYTTGERLGTLLGPYKLLHEIGEGGMGTVWMAEQSEPVKRRVALKVIKPGMDSRQVLARFEAERQALALMDHPNIAKVLDAGATTGGRPYFVMELVKGQPITEFCDKNRLTTRERLDLFVFVCNAIQHAHQKGVIHRDVKPSNVLVAIYDGKPMPKVIDFGVAKAIAEPLTDKTLFTRHGQVVGTFEYMSPEQATLDQLDIDTRSDVYSLGVLLYELLTGTTPLDKDELRRGGLAEVLRRIREEEPPKPSTRLTSSPGLLATAASYQKSDTQNLSRTVRGELDWIVMKALDKDRNRRFATANGLALDVERYLKDEPVQACPPTLSYRTKKYYRKHRTAISVVAGAAVLLVGGIIATSWQAIRATQAESVANNKQADAEKARKAEADQRVVADRERKTAQDERDAANAARAEVRRSHYAAAMSLIPVAWQAKNVKRVVELLDEQRPRPGEKDDLLGFEWHYWDRQAHAELRSLNVDGALVSTSNLSQDGTRLALWKTHKGESVIKVVDTKTGEDLFTSPPMMTVQTTLTLNRDGRRLAMLDLAGPADPKPGISSATGGELAVWDVDSGKPLFRRKVIPSEKMVLSSQVVFSPDSKRLATHESVGSFAMGKGKGKLEGNQVIVKLWDLTDSGKEPIVMSHETTFRSVSMTFSPDSSRLAGVFYNWGPASFQTRDDDQASIHVWDAATGKISAQTTSAQMIARLAFSPDGTRLAGVGVTGFSSRFKAKDNSSGVDDFRNHCLLWDSADSGELKLVRSTPLPDPAKGISSIAGVAYSPDGRRLATWNTSTGFMCLTDAGSGEERQVIKSPTNIQRAAFNSDGTRLLTLESNIGEVDGERVGKGIILKEWEVHADKPPRPKTKSALFDFVIWSNDRQRQAVLRPVLPGATIPTKGAVTRISVRDKAGKEIHRFAEHATPIMSLAFNRSGELICSWGARGEFKVWEVETGKVRLSGDFRMEDGARAQSVAPVSPDQQFLAVPDDDGLRIVSFDDLRELFSAGKKVDHRFYFSPDSRRLVTQTKSPHDDGGQVTTWDLGAQRAIRSERGVYSSVTFSPDGRWFATQRERTAFIQMPPDLAKLPKFNKATRPGEIAVWDALTGMKRAGWVDTNPGVGVTLRPMIFSPDGTLLALLPLLPLGTEATSVEVYDTARGKLAYRLDGHRERPGLLVFSPDGKRIATTSMPVPTIKREVKLWDAATGREMLSLQVPDNNPGALSFSPDGHRLMLGSTTWDATPRKNDARQVVAK